MKGCLGSGVNPGRSGGSLDGPTVPSEQDSLCLEMSATRKQGCGISQGLEGGPWCLAEFECSLILGHASASPASRPLPLLSPTCPLSTPLLQSPLRFTCPALRGANSVLTRGAQGGPDLGRRAAPTQSPTNCGVSAERPRPAGSCPSGELSIRRPPTSPALPHTFAQARPFKGAPSSAPGGRLGGLEGLEKSSKPRVSPQSLRVGPGALLGEQQRVWSPGVGTQASPLTDKRGEMLGGPWKPGACACIPTDLSSLHSADRGAQRGSERQVPTPGNANARSACRGPGKQRERMGLPLQPQAKLASRPSVMRCQALLPNTFY